MAIASALLLSVTTLAGNSCRHATLSPHLFKHELLNCRRRNLASTTALSAPRPPPEPSDGSDPERIPDWDQAWQTFNQKDSKEERETVTEEVALLRAGRKSQSDREDSGIRSNAESSGWSEATDRDDGPRLTQWGGSVRGGKYRLGEGADRMLDFWGNGDAMLYAAMAVIALIFILLPFRP